uniref:Uncharacterized protein n=1 Tax=Triticum urartu TaxID=4572 RepID=A0A8R7R5Y0_TRIUA
MPRILSPQERYMMLAFSRLMAPIASIFSKGAEQRSASSQIGANTVSWSSVQEWPSSSSVNKLITYDFSLD